MFVRLILIAGAFLSTSILANDHNNAFAGMDLSEGNSLQLNLCELMPGKSMADYEEVFSAYVKWSKQNDVEVYAMRAMPMFGGPDATAPIQYQFVDMLAAPYSVSGAAWDKWLGTEEGQRVNKLWQETAKCRVTVNPVFVRFADQEALKGDSRVMTINWCTRHEGVSTAQLIAKHDAVLASRPDNSTVAAWSVMGTGLGSRNAPGDFAHLLSFRNAADLMAYQNSLANEEGWRIRQDYETSYASCTGENVYQIQVLNRP